MSLKEQGLIGRHAAPMLLVNGDHDSQVPIADLDLLLHAGSPKEAWVNPGGGHMGRSADWPDVKIFREVVVRWIARQLRTDVRGHVAPGQGEMGDCIGRSPTSDRGVPGQRWTL